MSGLETVAECCVIPVHNDKDVEKSCENYCASKKKYRGDHMVCVLNCYVRRTRILTSRGKIIAVNVALLYQNNDFTVYWLEVINQGIASCHYESNGTLKENLIKYFNCVDEYLTEHCVWFKMDEGCYNVVSHFKNCQSPKSDCSKKPVRVNAAKSPSSRRELICPVFWNVVKKNS